MIPKGIRELQITEQADKVSEPVTKELVISWLKSDYLFAQELAFGLNDDLGDNDKPFQPFWTDLQTFSLKSLQSKISSS